MRRQVDEAELPQLARGGQAVELGLAGVGREQDPGGPIVGLEEVGRAPRLRDRVPGKGVKSSSPLRADRAPAGACARSAIATGAGRGSITTPSLPGASSRADDLPSLQISTAIGLSPVGDDFEVVSACCSAIAVVGEQHVSRLQAARGGVGAG